MIKDEEIEELTKEQLQEYKQEIAKHNAKVNELIESVEAIKSKLTSQIIDVVKANEKVRWNSEEDKRFNLQSNIFLKKVDINGSWIKTRIDKMMVKVWDYNHEAVEAICTEYEE